MSILGNIALQTESKNPDLVENISTADVDVLGHQKADRAILERCTKRNHHDMVISIQRACTESEKIHIRYMHTAKLQ